MNSIYSKVENITFDENKEYLRDKIMQSAYSCEYDEIFYLQGEATKEEFKKYKMGTSALGIILLVKNGKIEGITNIYPTAN